MVEACELTVGAEVGRGRGLWFDDGCEFVGVVVHSGSVGKVNESAGREAVTSR